MNQPQLIKHRVCVALFTVGLCLAVIHGAFGNSVNILFTPTATATHSDVTCLLNIALRNFS
jgi:hypothetical protein